VYIEAQEQCLLRQMDNFTMKSSCDIILMLLLLTLIRRIALSASDLRLWMENAHDASSRMDREADLMFSGLFTYHFRRRAT
jgi:hypothetical protein